MSNTRTIINLHTELAKKALPLWGITQEAEVRLLNFSENTTFFIQDTKKERYVLRIHRLGYHPLAHIVSELAWMQALDHDGALSTIQIFAGLDGAQVQQLGTDDLEPHYMVLFAFVDGNEPSPEDNLCPAFEQLGTLAARTHLHSLRWKMPANFARHHWDISAIFGDAPLWGHWRKGPNVTKAIACTLQQAEGHIIENLEQYGKSTETYGLIHADMRLANLLIDGDTTHVIDFDDCGFGWWMFDFAAAISFHEDHPQVPALKQAWLSGYQRIRPLNSKDIAVIETLIMMRRLQLLGWLGSHHDNLVASDLAPDFAQITQQLAENWMEPNG